MRFHPSGQYSRYDSTITPLEFQYFAVRLLSGLPDETFTPLGRMSTAGPPLF